jgi:hypothetical protein
MMIFKILFWRIFKITRDKEKISWAVSDLSVLQDVTKIVDFFNCFSTNNLQVQLLKRNMDMLSSFSAGVIIKLVSCQDMETCGRGRNYLLYLATLCLWALFKNLLRDCTSILSQKG